MATPDQTSSGTAASSAIVFGEERLRGDTVADTYVPWFERERRARRLKIIVVASVACAVLVAVFSGVLWNANAHYERGRNALVRGQYYTAVDEFAGAYFFTFPYRDAAALGATAERSLALATAAAASDRRRRDTVTQLLQKADERLSQGNAAGVVEAIDAARRVVPDGPLPLAAEATGLSTQLALRIDAVAASDLAAARWNSAERLAMAWLALWPGTADATELLAAARSGAALQAKLARARAAAAAGHWRLARRLALAVLAARKDFPGAAAVVSEARAALAPKPAPAPAAATSPPPSSGSSVGTPPAAPPPP